MKHKNTFLCHVYTVLLIAFWVVWASRIHFSFFPEWSDSSLKPECKLCSNMSEQQKMLHDVKLRENKDGKDVWTRDIIEFCHLLVIFDTLIRALKRRKTTFLPKNTFKKASLLFSCCLFTFENKKTKSKKHPCRFFFLRLFKLMSH